MYGGVATYIDHTHDRSMRAYFSTTVYCQLLSTGCVMNIKNYRIKVTGVVGSAGTYMYAHNIASHCSQSGYSPFVD